MSEEKESEIEVEVEETTEEKGLRGLTFAGAHELIRQAQPAWKPIMDNVTACAKFEDGHQWPTEAPPGVLQLTYNICPSFTNHAGNVVKKNPPSIKVIQGDEGDEKIAKRFDSLIDDIENRSFASSVYTSAFDQCTSSSFGMWRIVVEEGKRKDPATGKRRTELRLRHVKNPATVLIDPTAEQPGMVDMEWFCLPTTMTKKAFEHEFKGKAVDSFDTEVKEWFDGDTVTIAEFWFKDADRDGKWTQWIMSGKEILKKNTSWPGEYSPLCVVHGRERVYDDKRTFECMTARIMDPQRVLNAETTAWVESLDGVGGSEFLATAKQVPAEYEPAWKATYKGKWRPFEPDSRVPGGAPIHQPAAPIPTALMQGSQMAGEAMQKILGIRDPMKEIPGSQSGKAIALQMSQTDVAVFGYQFALEVAKTHCGCALVDLIPYFYNYEHTRNIKGRDGQVRAVEFGGAGSDSDLAKGSYDVIVSSGPTWESRREEEREIMLKLMGLNESWSEKWGDILLKTFDFDGSDVAAERLRVGMPPELLAAGGMDENTDPKVVVSMLQSQLRQAAMQVEQLTQALQAETAEREKLKAGTDAKMQMQQADHQHDAQMQAAKTQDQQALAQLQAQVAMLLKRMDIDGRAGLQESKAGIDSNARNQQAALDAEIKQLQHAYGLTELEAKAMQAQRMERVKFGHQEQLMVLDARIETAFPGVQVDQEDI